MHDLAQLIIKEKQKIMYEKKPVDLIEGIGPAYAQSLNQKGILYCEDLLSTNLAMIKLSVDQALANKLVFFQRQAELIQVTGSGQLAEALAHSNINDLNNLRAEKPSDLCEVVQQAKNAGIIQETIDEDQALEWIKKSTQYYYTGAFRGSVKDKNGNPVGSAVITSVKEKARTAADGTFWLPGIPFGANAISIEKDGFKTKNLKVNLSAGFIPNYSINLEAGENEYRNYDENAGNGISTISSTDRLEQVETKLEDLPDGTYLYYSLKYKNGDIKLHTINRVKKDGVITIQYVRVGSDVISASDEVGTTYEVSGGILTKLNQSVLGLRAAVKFGEILKLGYSLNQILKL